MAKSSTKRAKKKKAAAADPQNALVAANRQARFRYQIEETVEAGIVLFGTEVKAAREGTVNLTDSYVRMHHGEAYLVGCHFGSYAAAGQFNHPPLRDRKLLLHKRELDRLNGKVREKGLALICTKLYFKDGRLKAEVALGRGKKTHDKRATVREREGKKEMERAIKQFR